MSYINRKTGQSVDIVQIVSEMGQTSITYVDNESGKEYSCFEEDFLAEFKEMEEKCSNGISYTKLLNLIPPSVILEYVNKRFV